MNDIIDEGKARCDKCGDNVTNGDLLPVDAKKKELLEDRIDEIIDETFPASYDQVIDKVNDYLDGKFEDDTIQGWCDECIEEYI